MTRGSFVGLDLSHDRFHMARAIMEGVVFQILWMLESFPVTPAKEGLKRTGGASKSPVWSRLLADISGLPVRIPEVADMTCVGAAILAGVGCGIFRHAREGYDRLAVGERVLYPDPEKTALYRPLREKYRQLAGSLADAYGLSE